MNKYLSDGRKVAVIGALNSKESIVQEIFITSTGDEIPSGENFTVKSLHDEPLSTYKDKEIIKDEARIKKIKSDINTQSRKLDNIHAKLKAKQVVLKSVELFSENLDSKELEIFTKFITGTIEYLVIDSYSITKPVKLIDEIISWKRPIREDMVLFEEIKLLSVMGRSNGKLGYNINRYSDGSGDTTHCYPFTTHDEAVEHIKNVAETKIEKNWLGKDEFKICFELGIIFNQEEIIKYKENLNSNIKKSIARAVKTIEENKKSIEKLNEELNT